MKLPLAGNTLTIPLLWSFGGGESVVFPSITIPPEALAEVRAANEDSSQ